MMQRWFIVILGFVSLILFGLRIPLVAINNLVSLALLPQWSHIYPLYDIPTCKASDTNGLLVWVGDLLNSAGNLNQRIVKTGIYMNRARYEWLQGHCVAATSLVRSVMDQDSQIAPVVGASLWSDTWKDVQPELRKTLSQYAETRGNSALANRVLSAARQWYIQSILLEPRLSTASRLSEIYSDAGEKASAIRMWQDFAQAVMVNSTDYWWTKAHISELEQNWTQAIRDYQRLLPLSSDRYSILMYMGQAYQNLQDYEEALNVYKQASQLRPDAMSPYLYIGGIALIHEDYESALAWFDQAEKASPHAVEPQLSLGWAWCKRGDASKAENYFQSAEQVSLKGGIVLYYRALCARNQGNTIHAIEILNRAIDLNVDVGLSTWYWKVLLGDWLIQIGDTRRARDVYQQALTQHPGDVTIQSRIDRLK